jgi:hypothetical protein
VKARPPAKRSGVASGPRRLNGSLLDVASMARELGVTEKGVRARVARGVVPFRRWSGRIVFLREDVEAYLRQLPGVTVDQALANLAARGAGQ